MPGRRGWYRPKEEPITRPVGAVSFALNDVAGPRQRFMHRQAKAQIDIIASIQSSSFNPPSLDDH